MKKILVLFLTISSWYMSATNLKLASAIEKSDIQLVENILTHTSITMQEKTACLDLAQEMIIEKRQKIDLEGSNKIKNAIAAGTLALLSTTISSWVIKYCLSRDPYQDFSCLIPFDLVLFLVPTIWSCACLIKTCGRDKKLVENYQIAVKIKMLLWQATGTIE